MANQPSTRAIFVAVGASAALAVTKFIAGAFSGSAAMFSEGIHSAVDAGNSFLLYIGLRRSIRPRDAQHPFGYGKEVYFWTLIVSFAIILLGGFASILEGIWHLTGASEESPIINYIVLALAAVFNGYSWYVSYKSYRQAQGKRGFWEAAHTAKDPTLVTVFFEDCASLVGVVIAFLGIFLGHMLHLPALDGVASILIGLLMGSVGVWLTFEARSLLLGESADKELLEDVRRLVRADPAVERVDQPRTMHLGPEEVLLNLEIQFRRQLSVEELEAAIDRLEGGIREHHPEVKQIFLAAESLAGNQPHKEAAPK